MAIWLTIIPLDIFTRILPLAKAQNTRVILLNRREYPGSKPYSPSERDILLKAQGDGALAADAARSFWASRADEVTSTLEYIVEQGGVPQQSIILVGWSMAGMYMTSLLARPPANTGRVDLSQYIRRIICLGKSYD